MSTPLDRFAVARVAGEVLSLAEVLRRSQADALRRLIEEAIRERIIERGIIEHDIRVHPDEVSRARAVFAADRGLQTVDSIDGWLRSQRLTRGELDDQLRRIIAFGKLKDVVVGDRAEGADRSERTIRHRRIFEEWLEEQRSRLQVQITYQELL